MKAAQLRPHCLDHLLRLVLAGDPERERLLRPDRGFRLGVRDAWRGSDAVARLVSHPRSTQNATATMP
jgi:hypothetical protein